MHVSSRWIVVAAVAAAGCGSEAPTCEQALAAAGKALGMKDLEAGVRECKSKPWSEAARRCVAAVKDPGDLVGCAGKIDGTLDPTAAYEDYMAKSKTTEAKLNLNRLAKYAKAVYFENAQFPTEAAPLTPATSCCAGDKQRCAPVAADWATPAWQALEFEMSDPFQYRYEYVVVDPLKEVVVRAIGDLDCDQTTSTFEIRITATDGNPVAGELQVTQGME